MKKSDANAAFLSTDARRKILASSGRSPLLGAKVTATRPTVCLLTSPTTSVPISRVMRQNNIQQRSSERQIITVIQDTSYGKTNLGTEIPDDVPETASPNCPVQRGTSGHRLCIRVQEKVVGDMRPHGRICRRVSSKLQVRA